MVVPLADAVALAACMGMTKDKNSAQVKSRGCKIKRQVIIAPASS
jgi:hypothetical protein